MRPQNDDSKLTVTIPYIHGVRHILVVLFMLDVLIGHIVRIVLKPHEQGLCGPASMRFFISS